MPLVAGLVVLFLGWWKQWGIDPLAHPNRLNPLSEAPTQAPGKHKAKEELKSNQKQKYWTIDQNFKQTQPPTNTIKRRDLASWVTVV